MEEVIDRLLEGNFDYENGSLDFSCTKLEITMQKGECPEGSFRIFSGGGRFTEGRIVTTDSRMECFTQTFVGNEEEIFFCFHGEHLEEGDVIKGEFQVISNQGESYLPFVVTVEYAVLTSSLGSIKNLFHFANLAKTSPKEAVSLFYSPDFYKVFSGNDKQYYEYYQGLAKYPGNEQNVEEFLIGINKKQRIEYLTDVSEIRMEDPEGIAETSITITRNGWGYTSLWLGVEGDFLYLEKEALSYDDFLGNVCRLPVYVDSACLHVGNNYGCLLIGSGGEVQRLPVTVKYYGVGALGRRALAQKHQTQQLMEFYQAFRMKKISTTTWLKESTKLVERMTAADEKDVAARLFQAQLLITEERYNEAQWILDHAENMLEGSEQSEPALVAYYLYLTTLVRREENYINRITEQVETIYKRNRDEWRVAWLLLYLSEEYNRSFSKKWMFLEEQFQKGCTSPVIYIEAILLLNMNPSLLMRLERFERQILWYGAKNEILSDDVIMQLLYQVQRERDYSDSLFRILEACYRMKGDPAVLQEICSLLIKGGKTGRKWFKWYKRGVEQELRITRLYEYYMMSVDMDTAEPLPKMVLMYFSYQNNLSYERAAFLYASLYRHREGYPELYEGCRNQMEQFVTAQILKHRINRDLAYLYKNMLVPRMITEEVAQALSGLLFAHMVQINDADIRQVIVLNPALVDEQRYPVTDGRALVLLADAGCRLLFEDGNQNRYMVSIPNTIEKLMLPGKLVKQIAPLAGDSQELNLYLCVSGAEPVEITAENEERFRYLLEDDRIAAKLKREIVLKLMHYYYDMDKIRELDDCLERVAWEGYSFKERSEILRLMVLRGKEEQAYAWLRELGPAGMDAKILVRLCSRVIMHNDYVEDKTLTDAVLYAFRNSKYDEYCLRYLTLYFNGMTREFRDIWKAAVDFCVDTYELCEKMLIQMLFSGSFVGEKMDIFRAYVAGGAKPEVEAAFLSQCAYEYFVKDRLMENCVFEEIGGMFRRGEELHKVCKLAYIKYYAEHKDEITESIRGLLKDFIHEMIANHIHLKMFTEFNAIEDRYINSLSDKTILEYKAHPNARAIMHYCLEQSEGEEFVYMTEEMTEVYGGVCYKEFILFFGEQLQYYIMEESENGEQLTESGTIQKSDTVTVEENSKFNVVNDMSISTTLQDYETVDKLLAEYEYREFLRKGLFKMQ